MYSKGVIDLNKLHVSVIAINNDKGCAFGVIYSNDKDIIAMTGLGYVDLKHLLFNTPQHIIDNFIR